MQQDFASLGEQAFGEHADSLMTVRYKSHQDALRYLQSCLSNPDGVGVLSGEEGSGKTVTVRELATQLAGDADVAFVRGVQLKPRGLLSGLLTHFGFDAQADPDDELLRAVSTFAIDQTRSWQAPIVIIDDVDRMYPSTLRILSTLAALEVQGQYALRFILSGNRGLQTLLESDGLLSVAQRSPGSFALEPLTSKETMIYLHARLQSAGSERADTVFPFDVCDRLREQSGGWPGPLNRFALEAMKRATGFPISVVDTYSPGELKDQPGEEIPVLADAETVHRLPPQLVVTRDGKTVLEHVFKGKKVLIGRSDFADVMIDDDYVSKLHLMLLLYSDALVLLDLNSANGTTVNSVKVRKTILRDGDIITLGHHRLKVENAPAISAEVEELIKAPDTLKMKNLIDIRRLRAKRRIKSAQSRQR